MPRLLSPLSLAALSVAALLIAGTASAETLLVDRIQHEAHAQMPARGMRMAQVEARFGAPGQKLDARGGQKRQWPAIHRWVYPAFTVYFERDRVVDAVANQASPDEAGPKPAIR